MISEEKSTFKSTFRGLLPAPVVERPRVDVRSGQACLREYGMPWPLPGTRLELCLEGLLPHDVRTLGT